MFVKGIGVDIVKISRIEKALERWGKRFQQRLFTDYENFEARELKSGKRAAFYAMRFAAKEAFSKAVGTGIRFPLNWKAIEVRSEPGGRPYIRLSADAVRFCNEKGIHSWHLSLSDEEDYAVAFVVVTE